MGRRYTPTWKFPWYQSAKAWTRSRGTSRLASKPVLETAPASTCRYTREGTKLYVYFVLLACSWRMRVESVTSRAGERERVKQRVLARGIIALLQIIGQTPTRGERVYAYVYIHMCGGRVGWQWDVTRSMYCILRGYGQGVDSPPKTAASAEGPRRPRDWNTRHYRSSPFPTTSSRFLSSEWRRSFLIFPA